MSRKAQRSGLFHGHWHNLAGARIGKAQRADLAEAYRLWAVHRDIREGAVGAQGARPFTAGKKVRSIPRPALREHPAYTEDNPFH